MPRITHDSGNSRRHNVVNATTQVKIRRAAPISVTSIPCADCKADAGSKCVSENGNLKAQAHASRRRMSARLYNQEATECVFDRNALIRMSNVTKASDRHAVDERRVAYCGVRLKSTTPTVMVVAANITCKQCITVLTNKET